MSIRNSSCLVVQDTLQSLFSKLDKKYYVGSLSEEHSIGPGWLKYEWNDSVWNLDDGASLLDNFSFAFAHFLSGAQTATTVYLHGASDRRRPPSLPQNPPQPPHA